MNEFPVTFTTYANGTRERNFGDDWWAWVKTQPQDAMLLWLRMSNWDSISESWFEELIDNPDTDLAIIAVIFWGTSGLITAPGYLPAKIIGNLEKGFYKQSELWLGRSQFIDKAMVFAKLLREAGRKNLPYPFPRQLLGPLRGRKASVPTDYGEQVEEQIKLVEDAIEVTFHRSEDQYLANRNSMSFREETLAESEARLANLQQPLPDDPVSAFADLSDLDYIERYFLPLNVYEEFRRDPYERKERISIFATVSAVVVAGYVIFALILWLMGAFSKSPASHFGAVFSLSILAVLILGGLAMLWYKLKK
jgi:hypothetical protein